MRSKRTEMIPKEITTYKCDLCNFSTESNTGCCGSAPIQVCRYCKNDMCREHRHWYSEDDWGDRPYGFYACDTCNNKVSMAWDLALQFAGRHDDMHEITDEYFNNEKLEEIYNENNI